MKVAAGNLSRRHARWRGRAGSVAMWTQSELPEIVRRDEITKRMLATGLFGQVVAESLASLRTQPHDMHALESLLRAQWMGGDMYGALQSVRKAIALNPHEPGYRFMRGLMRQSVGMISEAMADFDAALASAESSTLRENIQNAIRHLEDWQLSVIQMLIEEDRVFRIEFSRDPAAAARSRGFALGHVAEKALPQLVGERRQTADCGLQS